MTTIIRTQAEIADADTSVLVATYNAMTGKNIKKFESRAIAENRVAMALLAAADRAGHAGVKKDEVPTAKTVAELPLNAADSAQADEPSDGAQTKKEEVMNKDQLRAAERAKRYPTEAARAAAGKEDKPQAAAKKSPAKKVVKKAAVKKVAAKKAAPAKKVPAAKKASAPRHNVYEKVKLTTPSVLRRPQEGSNRSKVLDALKKRKTATIDQLSDDVGFNSRSYVHKLVFQEWAEVVPA